MLCLSRKTEYALVALAYLVERSARTASAREIAAAYDLPLPLLMNLLKNLQAHRVLKSTRGVKGGYQLAADLNALSLYNLIAIVECNGQEREQGRPGAKEGGCGCLDHANDWSRDQHLLRLAQSNGPVQALQFKLVEFLKGVRVADLVLPGRRIDVPIERLRLMRQKPFNSVIPDSLRAGN
jgi:Rrf2 family protein